MHRWNGKTLGAWHLTQVRQSMASNQSTWNLYLQMLNIIYLLFSFRLFFLLLLFQPLVLQSVRCVFDSISRHFFPRWLFTHFIPNIPLAFHTTLFIWFPFIVGERERKCERTRSNHLYFIALAGFGMLLPLMLLFFLFFFCFASVSTQQILTNPFVYICTKYYEVNWISIIIPFKQHVCIAVAISHLTWFLMVLRTRSLSICLYSSSSPSFLHPSLFVHHFQFVRCAAYIYFLACFVFRPLFPYVMFTGDFQDERLLMAFYYLLL